MGLSQVGLCVHFKYIITILSSYACLGQSVSRSCLINNSQTWTASIDIKYLPKYRSIYHILKGGLAFWHFDLWIYDKKKKLNIIFESLIFFYFPPNYSCTYVSWFSNAFVIFYRKFCVKIQRSELHFFCNELRHACSFLDHKLFILWMHILFSVTNCFFRKI